MAYDMAAIEYRGLNAVTNFDLSRYIKWLRRGGADSASSPAAAQNPHPMLAGLAQELLPPADIDGVDHHRGSERTEARFQLPARASLGHAPTTSALSLLLQSPKFKEMIARTAEAESSTTSSSSSPSPPPPSPPQQQELQAQVAKDGGGCASPQCSFPDDIQTFFGCEDVAGVGVGLGYADVDGLFFGDLAPYSSPAFHFELDL